jgi:F420-dependent oxidoreductase-like protein
VRLRILLEPHHGATYAQILALAQAAEEGGFDAFFRSDHYLGIDADDTTYQPTDSWTTLAGLAVQTDQVRLGTLVNASTFRLPGQLAVEVATVSQMSGGRAELGIGAAWYEREHKGLGVPFPPISERFERLEETLQICHQMWSDDDGPYEGRHYQLAETICSPRPIQQPGPKILVGGSGERKTLRLVARYADGCNLFALDAAVVAHKLDVLNRHCEAEGRDPDSISRTILAMQDPLGDVDAFLTSMEEYAKLGITLVEVMPLSPEPAAWVTQLGERVIPTLRDL